MRFVSSSPPPTSSTPPPHPLYIHQSRLEWAGGALSRLALTVDADVIVGDHKEFALFWHIRRFLYGQHLDLDMSLVDLMRLVKLAYRWEVWEVVRGVTEYVRVVDLLAQSEEDAWVVGVVSAAEVVRLPGVDDRFVAYFWACVGRGFDKFVKVMGRRRWQEEDGWTGFPRMWEMALEQRMVATVFEEAVGRVGAESMREFLDVVLVELEPKMERDRDVSWLLEVLGRRVAGYGRTVLKEGGLDQDCSVRAMRLLAKAVLGGRRPWWGLRRLLSVPVQLLMWRAVLEGVRRIQTREEEGEADDGDEDGSGKVKGGFRLFGRV